MDRHKIEIANPCPEDFDEMEGEGARRFCDRCEKHVHNLSDMTRAEALDLLRQNADSSICVVYTYNREDEVRFRHEAGFRRPPKSQLTGLKRLLAAAAMVPMLAALPACDTSAPEDPPAIEQPCDVDRNSYRPIDEIIEAEERFLAEIREFLGHAPDIEPVVTAGEPVVRDIEPREPVEPTETVAPEVHVVERPSPVEREREVMGDMVDMEMVMGELEAETQPPVVPNEGAELIY